MVPTPSHVGAYSYSNEALTESASLRVTPTPVPNNDNKSVPNDVTSQDVTFDLNLWVGNPTNNYQLKK